MISNQFKEKRRWLQACFSNSGKRQTNEDRVEALSFKIDDIIRFSYLSACDGVAGSENGEACADSISSALKLWVKNYIDQFGKGALYLRQRTIIRESLLQLQVPLTPKGATATGFAIFDHKRKNNGYRLLVSWTGDCRVYYLDSMGEFRLLTCDQHDDENRLTGYYSTPDGKVNGELGLKFFTLPKEPILIVITTDGLHEKCSCDELKFFFSWCILQPDLGIKQLGHWAKLFIEENISDNYSASCLFRQKALPRKKLLNSLQENKQCKNSAKVKKD